MFDHNRTDHCFGPEHLAFRETMRAFVERELAPHVDEWEEAGRLPREIFRKFSEVGATGVLYPEALGGSNGDVFMHLIVTEELSRTGAGGVGASLNSHSIALPLVVKLGSEALKEQVARPVIAGEAVAALAVTEPGGGSDVAQLRTRAVRDGDVYIINGEKTFITSGVQADWLTVAVRTDPERKGASGVSLMVVPGDAPGVTRRPLAKMGWHASDTAHITFANVRVPVGNLLGEEGQGFRQAMLNFNDERIGIAAKAVATAETAWREARDWARERTTFGAPLIERQAIRHKLVDMALRINAAKALTYDVAWRRLHELDPLPVHIARTGMAKITATDALEFCASEAVQILGGMGYMRGTKSERIFRETKVLSIGGGADEILKDLIARNLDL